MSIKKLNNLQISEFVQFPVVNVCVCMGVVYIVDGNVLKVVH
jgi:hypothetical protein